MGGCGVTLERAGDSDMAVEGGGTACPVGWLMPLPRKSCGLFGTQNEIRGFYGFLRFAVLGLGSVSEF